MKREYAIVIVMVLCLAILVIVLGQQFSASTVRLPGQDEEYTVFKSRIDALNWYGSGYIRVPDAHGKGQFVMVSEYSDDFATIGVMDRACEFWKTKTVVVKRERFEEHGRFGTEVTVSLPGR